MVSLNRFYVPGLVGLVFSLAACGDAPLGPDPALSAARPVSSARLALRGPECHPDADVRTGESRINSEGCERQHNYAPTSGFAPAGPLPPRRVGIRSVYIVAY